MSNQEQSEYWNGDAGEKWVQFSGLLDGMLRPFAELAVTHAGLENKDDVMDIGCGAGALSLLAAQKANSVLGVDISSPLIDLAAQRAKNMTNVDFTLADAATFELEKKRDVILSRFGVMFFSEPVKAFANIRQQVKPSGRIVFICWQSPEKNMWARAPLEAAASFLKQAPTPPEPHAPGPFAFADPQYLKGVLTDAGWNDVTLTPWSGDIRLPGENANQAASFMMGMGPLSKILKEQELDMTPIHAALVKSLSAQTGPDGGVDMGASVWLVKANVI